MWMISSLQDQKLMLLLWLLPPLVLNLLYKFGPIAVLPRYKSTLHPPKSLFSLNKGILLTFLRRKIWCMPKLWRLPWQPHIIYPCLMVLPLRVGYYIATQCGLSSISRSLNQTSHLQSTKCASLCIDSLLFIGKMWNVSSVTWSFLFITAFFLNWALTIYW